MNTDIAEGLVITWGPPKYRHFFRKFNQGKRQTGFGVKTGATLALAKTWHPSDRDWAEKALLRIIRTDPNRAPNGPKIVKVRMEVIDD